MSEPSSAARRTRLSHRVELALSVYASAVFVILWAFVAVAAVTDAALVGETWAWLDGLDTIGAIIVWLAILPVAVFLWAWQAGLDVLLMGLLMVGLAAWSAVAWSGLLRALSRR